MSKSIGDMFMNTTGKWEIISYDNYTDEYLCHKLDNYEYISKNFRLEDMEGK